MVTDLQESRKKIDQLEHELREAKSEESSLKLKVESLNEKLEDLEKQLIEKKQLEEQYIETITELQKQKEAEPAKVESLGSGESNASNGWSDMDLGDLEEKDTDVTAVEEEQPVKKPAKVASLGKKGKKEKEASPEHERKSSTASVKTVGVGGDLMEFVKLKKDVKSLEAQRDELKRDLHTEQRSKDLIERELDELKKTLTEKRAELERIASDKDYFKVQSEQLQNKFDDATHKLEKLQSEKEKLLEEKGELQNNIFRLEADKRDALTKIKELEKLLNRAEEDNKKVETQLFNDQRKLGQHINRLEAELQKYRLSSSINEGVGSGNSSDFSFAGGNVGDDREVKGLWGDVDVDIGPETSFDK